MGRVMFIVMLIIQFSGGSAVAPPKKARTGTAPGDSTDGSLRESAGMPDITGCASAPAAPGALPGLSAADLDAAGLPDVFAVAGTGAVVAT